MNNDRSIIPDSKLVQLLKEDNELAFDEIFSRYWERLFVTTSNVLGDDDVAQDLVQEIFVSLWERRKKVDINNLSAFLFQAARNQVAKSIRKTRFTVAHEEALNEAVFVNTTEQLIDYEELRTTIDRSLQHLPSRCREVFQLSRFEHLSNKEIAEKLGLSIRTVETHISNAIKHLRNSIDPSSIALSALILLVP